MSRAGIILLVVALSLVGVLIYNLQPDRTAFRAKKRHEASTQAGGGKGMSGANKKSGSSGETGSGESGSGKDTDDLEDDSDDSSGTDEQSLYQLPYDRNIGYLLDAPSGGSTALHFRMRKGTPITAARSGIVAGVTGPAPKPGESMIFGRQMPRNAVLIQHADSSFALYQNVRAAGLDTGTVVVERTPIAIATSSEKALKLSISHPHRDDYAWKFLTRDYPKGINLKPEHVYLRSDSEVDHPVNAVTQIYTADAGDYRKTAFRRGETIRLHATFAFPIDADIRYAFRYPDTNHLIRRDARLKIDRKSSHYDLTPAETRRVPGTTWTAYLQFDDQVMDSTRFTIESP